MSFHTIISEFRTKLASPETQAKITITDLDQFYNKLNNLNFLFFKKYYRKYIDNLNRLKPDPEDKNPDWTLLQVAIAENAYKPTKPLDIFIHRLKYDYPLTSKPFVATDPTFSVTLPELKPSDVGVGLPNNKSSLVLL